MDLILVRWRRRGGSAETGQGGGLSARTLGSFQPRDTHAQVVDVLVSLISGAGSDGPAEAFPSCVCRAFCRLCAMRRALLLSYEDRARPFRPVGGHGAPFAPTLLETLGGSLGQDSALRRALLEDEARQISAGGPAAGAVVQRLADRQTLSSRTL